MQTAAAFWDRVAPAYARRPVSNPDAYEETLRRTRSHLSADDRVLEIGCGTASTAIRLAESVANYTATDVSAGMIGIARDKLWSAPVPNLSVRVAAPGDGSLAAALDGGACDAVLAFNLVHLLDDPGAALRELHGLLAPGGLFISKTPCLGGKLWLRPVIAALQLVGRAPRVRYFRIREYDAMIRAAGFEIVETGLYPASSGSRFVVARKT